MIVNSPNMNGSPTLNVVRFVTALARGDIYAVFQPQVDARTQVVMGFELLARWSSASGEHIEPSKFIPLIEGNDIERELLLLMIKSISDAAALYPRYQGTFSLNASQWLLSQPKFSQWLAVALKAHHVSGKRLIIEMTERVAIGEEGFSSLQKNFAKLALMGVKLSLDDFGAGAASLQVLDLYDFRHVKIDKQFLHRARDSSRSATSLRSIVKMVHAMNATATVEGVETETDLRLATSSNADWLQGNLIGMPCTVERLFDWKRSIDDVWL